AGGAGGEEMEGKYGGMEVGGRYVWGEEGEGGWVVMGDEGGVLGEVEGEEEGVRVMWWVVGR
ncbi:hypothetical protein, partial [Dermacoccus nishinomiyaensis]|uniref:hypothetical protein n=1 Tax=Dermacoccus nishinomiyaensis TaxID=1274 RepID=UPI003F6A7A0E